jgi:tetratricopeptide (TPR) repeat protein
VAELVTRSGAWLRRRLARGADAPGGERRGLQPSTAEAARLYAEGVARLRVFEMVAARQRLEKAVAADPSFAMARVALSEAWSELGYDRKAQAEALRALESSLDLPRDVRLGIEARYYAAGHQWDRAIESYEALWRAFPDDLDRGIELARAQTEGGRAREALETLGRIRALPAPLGSQARVELLEASIAQSVSDFRRQRDAAGRAASAAQAVDARLVVAAARDLEGWALYKLGETEPAKAALRAAERAFGAAGDQASRARSLASLALIAREQGDLAQARRGHEEALRTFRSTGNQRSIAWALTHVGIVAELEGDAAGARRAYDDALGSQREIGDQLGVARSLLKIADLDRQGGALAAARGGYDEALGIVRGLGTQTLVAYALAGLGDVAWRQGDLPAARASHREALDIRRTSGERARVAESSLALAGLARDEANLAEAETAAREAAEEFQKEGLRDLESLAYGLHAECLAALGRAPAARAARGRAVALAARSRRPSVRLAVAVAAGRVQVALSEAGPARPALEEAVAGARKAGLLELELEARLALAQAELAANLPSRGRARLEELERQARAQGFLLLARKAAAARAAL